MSELKTSKEKDEATLETKTRYDRIAPIYDLLEGLVERLAFSKWRGQLMKRIEGEEILEVGTGTGKNLSYYPSGVKVTAMDISREMLKRAEPRAKRAKASVALRVMDVEAIDFPGDYFDTSLATFVFCSVPDPIKGLQEMKRVTKSDGKILLLEHMRPNRELLGKIFDLVNPLIVKTLGPNINRKTMENIRKAGLEINWTRTLTGYGIVKLIEASPT
ncbi:MAG: class I SAM-dependent methyltransferase [Candidatus Bipolaricaulia bacterium]